MSKNIFQIIRFLVTSAFIFFIGAVIVYGQGGWLEPKDAPPGGNVAAPINVGSIFQRRLGALEIAGGAVINSGGATIGLTVPKGNVGIGTLNPDSNSALTIDLTGHSGQRGREAIHIKSSRDNPFTGLIINNNLLTFWSTSLNKPAEISSSRLWLDKDGGSDTPRISTEVPGTSLDVVGAGADPNRTINLYDNTVVNNSLSVRNDVSLGRNLQVNNNANVNNQMSVGNRLTVGGRDVCLKDRTNCPAEIVYKRSGDDYCGGAPLLCIIGLPGTTLPAKPQWRDNSWQVNTGTWTRCDFVLCTQ